MKRYLSYLKNQKGQGMTEYIVIVALAVGMITLFFPTIRNAIKDKAGDIAREIKKPQNE